MRCFVTGGSRGIGRALVLDLLEAGHEVAFTYVSNERAAEEVRALAAERFPERRCLSYRLDVADSAAVERVGEAVLDELGGVEVVVNNAGVNHPAMAISLGDEDWHRVVETNLSGAFFVARQFLDCFLAARRGRFVHVSSVSQGGMAGQVAYSASKAGLVGLSGALAKEYGRKGITSNVLVLGFFETDMTRTQMSDDNKSGWLRNCPTGRGGRLSEVSAAVLYLASDGAGFVNGHCLNLTGGLDWFP